MVRIDGIVKQLEDRKRKLDNAVKALEALRPASTSRRKAKAPWVIEDEPKGGVTAAGRKKLSNLMRRRWAKAKRLGQNRLS